MSLPKNLKLTDLILKEPVDFKAMGQDDQIKYQRHRRRTSYTGGESVEFSVNNSKRKINPENLLLWGLPYMVLIIGGVIIVVLIRKSSKKA